MTRWSVSFVKCLTLLTLPCLIWGSATGAVAQTETVIHAFQSTNKHDGILPLTSGVVADRNGALYGVTNQGGANGYGCVYKLSLQSGTWKESILYSFTAAAADGKYPQGNLLLVNGKIYGTTQQGGSSSSGTVYQLTPPAQPGNPWTETVIYTFTGGRDGKYPVAGLTLGNKGVLYGTASGGGDAAGDGVAFALAPPATQDGTWTERIVHAFQGGADGRGPISALVLYGGALFGSTSALGQYGVGTIFQLSSSPSGAWTNKVLYAFQGGADGAYPTGSPVLDGACSIYGTTSGYTSNTRGTVFQLIPASGCNGPWTLNTLITFQDGSDGGYPQGSLVLDQAGALYGTTLQGGNSNCGVAFELIPPSGGSGPWTENILHTFTGGNDGCFSYTALLPLGASFYGTTSAGDQAGAGTVFQITP